MTSCMPSPCSSEGTGRGPKTGEGVRWCAYLNDTAAAIQDLSFSKSVKASM